MPDWDQDSPELRANLARVLRAVANAAEVREKPTVASARDWQRETFKGLASPDPRYIGAFRGEPGLEAVEVKVLSKYGSPASSVAEELTRFESKLQALVAALDSLVPISDDPDADQLAAILDLCAWVHSEWVRTHPFVNGNGRTARLWANSIAMRYGLPPFVRLRPRPNAGYAQAGAKAMEGDWTATATVFRDLFDAFLDELAQ